jgi:hypothetical protein
MTFSAVKCDIPFWNAHFAYPQVREAFAPSRKPLSVVTAFQNSAEKCQEKVAVAVVWRLVWRLLPRICPPLDDFQPGYLESRQERTFAECRAEGLQTAVLKRNLDQSETKVEHPGNI